MNTISHLYIDRPLSADFPLNIIASDFPYVPEDAAMTRIGFKLLSIPGSRFRRKTACQRIGIIAQAT